MTLVQAFLHFILNCHTHPSKCLHLNDFSPLEKKVVDESHALKVFQHHHSEVSDVAGPVPKSIIIIFVKRTGI